jgi:hypothetical protein
VFPMRSRIVSAYFTCGGAPGYEVCGPEGPAHPV